MADRGNAVAAVCAWFLIVVCAAAESWGQTRDSEPFVRVSPRDSRYFELTDGRPYIPVGFNLVGPDDMQRVVSIIADSGVNYCRIWLDQPPWNIEHARSGMYDEGKARQLDRFLSLCRMRGIRRSSQDYSSPRLMASLPKLVGPNT